MATEHTMLPNLDGLKSLLDQWRGATAYIVEYGRPGSIPLGNNGDRLLSRVFEKILPELGLSLTRSANSADVLLVRPGGALLDRYQAPHMLAKRLSELPDIPLIIFPSSSWFETTDPANMFARRSAQTIWISREAFSHNHLRDQWGESLHAKHVSLELDHDVVVSGHDLILEALGLNGSDIGGVAGTLLVARMGAESGPMTAATDSTSVVRRLAISGFRRMPRSVQIAMRKRATLPRQLRANESMLHRVADCNILFDEFSPWSIDISDPTLATYNQFAGAVASASAVVTDRLHVALPSAIIGKRTWLVESGYHKLRGVYQHSLWRLPNLRFVKRP